MKRIQKEVNKVFKENFGYTPLSERLNDIERESSELIKYTDVKNLKEEAGDLLASLIQLHNESGWDLEENIQCTLTKIKKRSLQYKSLGRKTKVALLGGAFDPITNGHIALSKFVLDTSREFDEVWLLPAFKHMGGKDMTHWRHRLQMCKLASENDGRIKVWDYEIKNQLGGETYYLFKRLKEDEELNNTFNFSMIIGLDNALHFDKWVNFEELERIARFVTVSRKGYSLQGRYDRWFLKAPHIFLRAEDEIPEISSTLVRNTLIQNRDMAKVILQDHIHPSVSEYIFEHNLYST